MWGSRCSATVCRLECILQCPLIRHIEINFQLTFLPIRVKQMPQLKNAMSRQSVDETEFVVPFEIKVTIEGLSYRCV